MTTATAVRLIPGNVSTSLVLRQQTALLHCTDIDNNLDGRGALGITRNWPGLSSGEELVFAVLSFVNGGDRDDLPSWDDLRAGLDAANLAAVETALATVGVRCG